METTNALSARSSSRKQGKPATVDSPCCPSLAVPDDHDPAGEITDEMKAGSLWKRGRSDKASVVEAANALPTRSSSRKQGKPMMVDSPACPSPAVPANPDPAGGITAELKAGSLRKRGRSGKASVAEAANVLPTRLSSRKRGKPTTVDSPACPSPAVPPQGSAPKKGAKGQITQNTTVTSSRSTKGKGVMVEEDPEDDPMLNDDDKEVGDALISGESVVPTKRKAAARLNAAEAFDALFVGDPILEEEAVKGWPERYQNKEAGSSRSRKLVSVDPDDVGVKGHYRQAMVDGALYNL